MADRSCVPSGAFDRVEPGNYRIAVSDNAGLTSVDAVALRRFLDGENAIVREYIGDEVPNVVEILERIGEEAPA